MDECKNCQNKSQACVPFFVHENTMMHYNYANRRMLIAMITVCVTFILTIIIFVFGYTVREKNWLNTISDMQKTQAAEVQNGVHEQSDQSADH